MTKWYWSISSLGSHAGPVPPPDVTEPGHPAGRESPGGMPLPNISLQPFFPALPPLSLILTPFPGHAVTCPLGLHQGDKATWPPSFQTWNMKGHVEKRWGLRIISTSPLSPSVSWPSFCCRGSGKDSFDWVRNIDGQLLQPEQLLFYPYFSIIREGLYQVAQDAQTKEDPAQLLVPFERTGMDLIGPYKAEKGMAI